MTVEEIEKYMCSVAQEIIDNSSAQLSALPQTAKLEIKAQKIRKNMAAICQTFVKMQYRCKNASPTRRKFVSELAKIPENLSEEEITYLHALLRIEDIFLKKYVGDLDKAKYFNDDENIFKLETQLEVLKYITKKWREFGRTEGFSDEY